MCQLMSAKIAVVKAEHLRGQVLRGNRRRLRRTVVKGAEFFEARLEIGQAKKRVIESRPVVGARRLQA